jgi:uncharacterized C2H2 Zn-finger protein
MTLKPLTINKHTVFEVEPDVDDSNNYCRSKRLYRHHLTRVHRMILKPLVSKLAAWRESDPNIIPDQDDPNFYCCVCERNFNTRKNFRRHLQREHKMKLRPREIKWPFDINILPELELINLYDSICKRVFGYWGIIAEI